MSTNKEGLRIGYMDDGRKLLVRNDRSRFFMPDEWKEFIKSVRDKNKSLFEFLIGTGARIDEAAHIRPRDFDFERGNVRLWKTKTKAKLGETVGKPRTISISSQLNSKMKKLSKDKNPESYLFFPEKDIGSKLIGVRQKINQLIKRRLIDIKIKDWWNFSSHNIRKTHGMFLKALGIDLGEFCQRLGHDYNTYIKHYGSPDIFSEKDMRGIREILGDLYMRHRKF